MRDDLPHRFEGREVLAGLLEQAGAECTVADVEYEFDAALEEDADTPPGALIPLLFEQEPRFVDARAARRLYSNLLGLWDQVREKRLRGGLNVLQDGEAPAPEPPEGGAEGPEVPQAYADFAWRELVESTERERRKAEDRFENRQGDLASWIREVLSEAAPEAEEVALGLAVATHEAFLRAFGTGRVRAPDWKALQAALAALEQGAEETQPALAGHHDEVLEDALKAAEGPLDPADRPAVERALAVTRLALTRALAPKG